MIDCRYGGAQVYTLDYSSPDECVKPYAPHNGLAFSTSNGTIRVAKFHCNDGYEMEESSRNFFDYCPRLGEWQISNDSYRTVRCVTKSNTMVITNSDPDIFVKFAFSKVLNIMLFMIIMIVILSIVVLKIRDNRRNKKFLESLRQNSTYSTRYESAYVYEKPISFRETLNPAYVSLKVDKLTESSDADVTNPSSITDTL